MAKIRLISQRAMNKLIAPLPQVQAAVEGKAHEIGAKAEAALAAHRKTGEHRIEVEKHLDKKYGFLDMEVALVGEAAEAIEFGHPHNFTGKPVQGLYIVTRAAGVID